MNKVPLKFNIQAQMYLGWLRTQEDYKRQSFVSVWGFFQDTIRNGCVLDLGTRECVREATWFIQVLVDIYTKSYCRNHGDKVDIKLSDSERYLILIYYITLMIAETYPVETITEEHFQSLFEEWVKRFKDNTDLSNNQNLKQDLDTVVVLLQLHGGDYYETVKGLVE